MVRDGRAKLVNFSYGVCELYAPNAIRQADNSFKAAAIANVTVFVSSGDQGSYECGRIDPTDHRLTVPWPASSPYVVSVGGTHVNLRTDGTRLDEFGWEGVLSRSGGGGGLSRLFARPSWQAGVPGVQQPVLQRRAPGPRRGRRRRALQRLRDDLPGPGRADRRHERGGAAVDRVDGAD